MALTLKCIITMWAEPIALQDLKEMKSRDEDMKVEISTEGRMAVMRMPIGIVKVDFLDLARALKILDVHNQPNSLREDAIFDDDQ